jgi:hypothetical protein
MAPETAIHDHDGTFSRSDENLIRFKLAPVEC